MALPGVRNEVDAAFYDSLDVTAALAGSVQTLFQNRVNSGGKTRWDTNMKADGEFPVPEVFQVNRIALIPRTSAAADADNVLNNTVVELTVDQKPVHDWISFLLPGGSGIPGVSDMNGVADIRNAYSLTRPIVIEAQTPFAVNLYFSSGLAPAAAVKTYVVLDGILTKAVG